LTWTDIHSHILPGFDDGASRDEELLQMARMAVDGGTIPDGRHAPLRLREPLLRAPGEAAAAVEAYNGLLKANGIPLVLAHGMEVRVNAGLVGCYLDDCPGAGNEEISEAIGISEDDTQRALRWLEGRKLAHCELDKVKPDRCRDAWYPGGATD